MQSSGQFTQKKLRNAELIRPPNRLKQKVGHGGIDPKVIEKAQKLIEANSQDFKPIAEMYLDLLTDSMHDAPKMDDGEKAIENMIYPAMQLKAQGTMFKYPLITAICDILVNFLERIKKPDEDAMDVVNAHRMALRAIIGSEIKGSGGDQEGELVGALREACKRYFKSKS